MRTMLRLTAPIASPANVPALVEDQPVGLAAAANSIDPHFYNA